MYEEIRRERNNGEGQTNNEGIHVQMKPQFKNMPRALFQDVRVSNIIQCSKWKWKGGTSWENIDMGDISSPEPTTVETDYILKNTPPESCREIIVDTASIDYLYFCADLYWNSYGSKARNLTYHSPNTTISVPNGFHDKLRSMYEGKQNQGVREMRRYTEEEKIHRSLRWLSRSIIDVFGLKSEVQCYYDISQNRILVSVNTSRDFIKLGGLQLQRHLSFKRLLDLLNRRPMRLTSRKKEAWSNRRPMRLTSRKKEAWSNRRSMRLFSTKKRQYMMDAFQQQLEGDGEGCRGISIQFLPPGRISNMHAEQRILRYLQSGSQEEITAMVNAQVLKRENDEDMTKESLRLNPQFLGGLRRCCLACARACFTKEDYDSYKPGPLWVSHSALDYLKPGDIVNIIDAIRRGNDTYVTESSGHLTFDLDSDSAAEEFP